jgi:integrase
MVVTLVAWCQMRRGEILGLRRSDVDELHSSIRVEQSRTFTLSGTSLVKKPKTTVGSRTIKVPASAMLKVRQHLDLFVEGDADALIIVGSAGRPVTPGVLQRAWGGGSEKLDRAAGPPS